MRVLFGRNDKDKVKKKCALGGQIVDFVLENMPAAALVRAVGR